MKYYIHRLRSQGIIITSEAQARAYKGYGFGYITDIREIIDESPLITEEQVKDFIFEIRSTIKDEIHSQQT
jgi:hypothetical protein